MGGRAVGTYGVAGNYYALTHPSAPNYFPMLGGSDFGYDYDNPTPGINEPNLADTIEATGKTWTGYIGPEGFLHRHELTRLEDPAQRPGHHVGRGLQQYIPGRRQQRQSRRHRRHPVTGCGDRRNETRTLHRHRHYDHYSLLTTIEHALGLPALTNNDKYAQPMNEFWTTHP